jgi:putative lipoprotein
MAEIAGSVVYRQRIALPPGSVVEVSIADASDPDVARAIVGKTEIVTRGQQVPLPFRVEYDASSIVPGHRYQARVRVMVGGRVRWTNDTASPVINDAPTEGIVVVVAPVRG